MFSRFIPACAGNSVPLCFFLSFTVGSSPLARGTLVSQASVTIFPAVHPRLRGELISGRIIFTWLNGSSPLARGTRCAGSLYLSSSAVHPRLRGELDINAMDACNTYRFIPACAGNSLLTLSNHLSRYGSSPLARGTRISASSASCSTRFIPACAGNSARLCHVQKPSTGSSPLARGTRFNCFRFGNSCRFIPACAGNSPLARSAPFQLAVHPRLRGELT